MPPFLSIVIPAHNEEQRLPHTLARVMTFLDKQPYESDVWVVNSGSQDGTQAIAEEFAGEFPTIQVLRAERPGKGLAVRQGMLSAKGQYRFICDADLSMPIEEVNRFLPPQLTDYEVAIGSREVPGAVRYAEPLHRHFIGRMFNWMVRIIAVPGIQDTQCGFKCFRGEIADDLFRRQRLDGWTFDVELLFIARRLGYGIVEVAIPWYYYPGSRVRLLKDSLVMFTDLFRIRLLAIRGAYDRPNQDRPAA